MKKLLIGLVDLDTSGPADFLSILRQMGHEVVGVYHSGIVYPKWYADKFAARHGIERVFHSLEQMAEHVDLGIIHSCNWDLHIERAQPFISLGKAVLIDKPLAGNVRDLTQISDWIRQGGRIAGGSSLRYCHEVQEWIRSHDAVQDWVYGFAGCAADEFYDGIHAYSMLIGMVGSSVESVRWIGATVQDQIELTWVDGRRGIVSTGASDVHIPFYATIVSRKDVIHFQVDRTKLYWSLLESNLPYLAGEAPAPTAIEALIEVELSAIAARLSRERMGQRVYLQEIAMDSPGYDGTLFSNAYRKQKMGC